MTNEQLDYLIDLIEKDIKQMYVELRSIKDELEWEWNFQKIQNKTRLQSKLELMKENESI